MSRELYNACVTADGPPLAMKAGVDSSQERGTLDPVSSAGGLVEAAECGDTLSVMVDVQPIDAPSNVMLPDELPAVNVLILPREVSDGRGLYDDSVMTLAKEIRAAGVTADYQHDANSRKWIGEKHVNPLVLDIIAGLITNAGWAGMMAAISMRKSERVRVRSAGARTNPGVLRNGSRRKAPAPRSPRH